MSKQDRTYTRTAAEVERKYNLGGGTSREFGNSSQLEQAFSQFVVNTNAKIEALERKYSNLRPVGAIYVSTDGTDPAELFGGEWENTGQGYLLVGLEPESEEAATQLQFLDNCYIWKRTA